MNFARKIWNSGFLNDYVRFSLLLFFIFVFTRICETTGYFFSNPIPSGFIISIVKGLFFDFTTAVFFSAIFLIPFLLVYLLNKKAGRIFMISIHIILVILNIFLALYFIYTLIPLDHVIYSYTSRDILMTVKASSGSVVKEVLTIVFVLIVYFLFLYFYKYKSGNKLMKGIILSGSLLMVIFPSFIVYDKDENSQNAFITNNKLGYFTAHSLYYYFDDRAVQAIENIDRSFLNKENLHWESLHLEYPLLHKNETPDLLGNFFNCNPEDKPDIVFIIVESLSGSFFTSENGNGKFMPFLDSLKNESLYWPNFLSAAERTFGVLPSVLGSLPYSKYGFTEIGERGKFPRYISLLSILKNNGYFSRFYIGAATEFNNMDGFMYNSYCDYVVDSWPAKYELMGKDKDGFSWGYSDRAIFNRSFDDTAVLKIRKPRFDVFLTSTMHAPYRPPQEEKYDAKLKKVLEAMNLDAVQKEKYLTHAEKYRCVLFTDDALKEYFNAISKTPRYKNTIFFIFGDHAMEDIYEEASGIEKYHIPFIVYSPMLKKSKKMKSVSTQLDIAPALTAFMKKNYSAKVPENVHWLGSYIDTAVNFRNIHSVPFIRNNKSIIEYLSGNYFLSGEKLFRINEKFKRNEISDESRKEKMKNELKSFISLNDYVCEKDKIYPESEYQMACPWQNILFSNFIISPPHRDSTREFIDLFPQKELKNKYSILYLELSFDFYTEDTTTKNYPFLTTGFSDTKNKEIHWQGDKLVREDKRPIVAGKWNHIAYVVRINTERLPVRENIFKLGASLWNPKRISYGVKNISFRIRYGVRNRTISAN